uniref:ZP domain-containing protein n=1 Tax=Panagrolaimus davidi TaxID=227884 RepID=A0A914QSZ4_9BILA
MINMVQNSVKVGDALFHQWKCSSTGKLYCIMVHSCSISHNIGRKAKRVEIIDEFGCSVYPELVPNMHYFNDTEAGFQANAFLIDIEQMSLFFQCSLKFLVKTDGFCRRPLCARKN